MPQHSQLEAFLVTITVCVLLLVMTWVVSSGVLFPFRTRALTKEQLEIRNQLSKLILHFPARADLDRAEREFIAYLRECEVPIVRTNEMPEFSENFIGVETNYSRIGSYMHLQVTVIYKDSTISRVFCEEDLSRLVQRSASGLAGLVQLARRPSGPSRWLFRLSRLGLF